MLDQNHPDWDKGREEPYSFTSSTNSTSGISTNDSECSTADDSTSATNTKATTLSTETVAAGGDFQTPGVSLPSISGAGARVDGGGGSAGSNGPGYIEDDRKQVGVLIGQRTDKLVPYHTTGGLPMYCR